MVPPVFRSRGCTRSSEMLRPQDTTSL